VAAGHREAQPAAADVLIVNTCGFIDAAQEESVASLLDLLARIRAALPGVAIRSTFIAGLPGETEEEFEDALAFVGEAGLAAAGVFPYDAQKGTAAARLPGQVAADVTFGRASRLSERIDEVAVGRCAVQAPDIDGRTLVGGAPLRRGQLVHAFAVGSAGYDVEAVAGSREP